MHRFWFPVLLGAVTLFPNFAYLMAQEVITSDDPVAPGSRSIVLERVATLAPPPELLSFTALPPISVARGSRGSYFAGPARGNGVLAIFDLTGAFLRHQGRVGEGPDEFLGQPFPMTLRIGDDGHVYAFEGNLMHVLDSTGSRTLQRSRIPLRPNDAVLLGSSIVVQAPVEAPAGQGTVMQIVDLDGTSRRGIGVTSARPLSLRVPFDGVRKLARGTEPATVWSSYVNRYEMSLFAESGEERIRLIRSAPWFVPYDTYLVGEPFIEPQRPRVEGVIQGGDGLVWTLISRAAEGFEPMSDPGSQEVAGEMRIDPYVDFNQYLDTIIEVLDLTTREVVARQTFEGQLRFVDTPNDEVLLFAVRPDESEELMVEIFSGGLR
ncbi:MAG: hypothetical protein EA422_01330 [Gemmatimonadales bacterium]|nr:MAG: hypothetical protein EA422_01330 [Gemmatimonadales bacterium]